MDKGKPTIKNGKIAFPEGTDASQVRTEKCLNCPFGLFCTEAREGADGVVIAENKSIYPYSDEFIARQANCEPALEGHPVER